MPRRLAARLFLSVLAFGALFAGDSRPAAASPSDVVAGMAYAEPSSTDPIPQSLEPPTIDAARLRRMHDAVDHSNLSGPAPSSVGVPAAAVPPPGTESAPSLTAVPEDPILVRNDAFGVAIPGGFKSNVLEASIATGGRWSFVTGNWFAAWDRSAPGVLPAFISPYVDMGDFCCDQVTLYVPSRNMYVWLRQGIPGFNGGNYDNRFRISLARNDKTKANQFSCSYDFEPTGVNPAWTNQWFDYPHVQAGADFLYVAYNVFNQADLFVRTVVLRLPLDALRRCQGFSFNYLETAWATLVPVQGADHTMYLASNWPPSGPINTKLGIWKWREMDTSITFFERDIADWTTTLRSSAVCGNPNWTGRTDQRVLTGARYEINGADVSYPGRKVIAWWWNVAQGGGFPRPYIEGAAFFESDLTQVPGNAGRPLVWNESICFAYPSVAGNRRGDAAMVFHYSTGPNNAPSVAFAIADDVVTTPPGWDLMTVATGNAPPLDSRWGDYNTVRPYAPTGDFWTAASHFIPGSISCDPSTNSNCATPVFFIFGRDRDVRSYRRWRRK